MGREPGLIRRVWQVLNRITPSQLLEEGRVYGGGLHKLEPRELANVVVPELAELFSGQIWPGTQTDFFQGVE